MKFHAITKYTFIALFQTLFVTWASTFINDMNLTSVGVIHAKQEFRMIVGRWKGVSYEHYSSRLLN